VVLGWLEPHAAWARPRWHDGFTSGQRLVRVLGRIYVAGDSATSPLFAPAPVFLVFRGVSFSFGQSARGFANLGGAWQVRGLIWPVFAEGLSCQGPQLVNGSGKLLAFSRSSFARPLLHRLSSLWTDRASRAGNVVCGAVCHDCYW